MGIFKNLQKMVFSQNEVEEFNNTQNSSPENRNTTVTPASYNQNNQLTVVADEQIDINFPFVEISTSGDDQVCQMCKQFDGMLFRVSEVPTLPLHPFCGCVYMHHETAGRRKIRNPSDFVLPAKCTESFCINADLIESEKDYTRRISLCEEGLSMLAEFLKPYISAGWKIPEVLPCFHWAMHDYMATGHWDDAERVIHIAADAGIYSSKSEEKDNLLYLQKVCEVSNDAIKYLTENPGTLQRNIYRKLCPPCDRGALKWFLTESMQIRKEKDAKTNKLFVADTI